MTAEVEEAGIMTETEAMTGMAIGTGMAIVTGIRGTMIDVRKSALALLKTGYLRLPLIGIKEIIK
jgi:hypothetical protein